MGRHLGRLRDVLLGILVVASVAGCGAAPERRQAGDGTAAAASRTSDDAVSADEAALRQPSAGAEQAEGPARALRPARDPVLAVSRTEPAPWRAYEWAVAPAGPARALLASVELPPGAAFRLPSTSCQDAILFVREGELRASGTGIAPADAPTMLQPGDAVRFGPEGDGIVVNFGPGSARAVLAVARRAGTGAARLPPPADDACALAPVSPDPLRRPLRVASVATSPPLIAAGGRLQVRILLDEEGAGARHGALSLLEGAPDLVVPEHVHPGVAEILLVEDGEGTMRIGERDVAVGPGTAIYVPEDTVHAFRGAGSRPLRAIQIYAPAGPEQRFRGSSRARPPQDEAVRAHTHRDAPGDAVRLGSVPGTAAPCSGPGGCGPAARATESRSVSGCVM